MNIRLLILTSLLTATTSLGYAAHVQWISSTPEALWQEEKEVHITAFQQDKVNDVIVTRYTEQQMLGFGGCFGELGWDALLTLDEHSRRNVLVNLFDTTRGANLSFCRTPIGANDFARNYYSLNDHDGDFKMKHFSIARDRTGLIPYIKAALSINPEMRLWACPWTPPVWMKKNRHYATKAGQGNNYAGPDMKQGEDQFIMQDKYLKAYARYFDKYLTAYEREGINVSMIMFQNEPYTINIWPNCTWSVESMKRFIGSYLGPVLKRSHSNVEIWHGTMNTDRLDDVEQVVTDKKAGRYISGGGFQWEGKDIVGKVHRLHHNMPLMCTENECGDGSNDWAAAEHTFDMVKHYIDNGVATYMYFNMVLKQDGLSAWGWRQNSLVVIDPVTHQVTYTPEYYLMKHLSRYVAQGACKLKTIGNDEALLAFRNPDGTTVVIVANKHDNARKISIVVNADVIAAELKPNSFNTLIIK